MHAFSTGHRAKSRHPGGGVVGALAGPHSLAGERPARLLRVLARMRAATLFCCLRPGRACHQNSPARPSGKAGPPRFVALHNASLRSFLPCSAVPRPNQGGPVSPDGRAASAVRMLRTFSPPWTGCEKADRENRVGAIVPLSAAWARRTSVRIAFYRVPIRASAYRNAMCRLRRSAEGCQHLLGVGGGLLAAKSCHRLLGVGGAGGACSLKGARASRFAPGCSVAPSRVAIAQPSAGLARSASLGAPRLSDFGSALRALCPRPACGGLDSLASGEPSARRSRSRIGLAQPAAGLPCASPARSAEFLSDRSSRIAQSSLAVVRLAASSARSRQCCSPRRLHCR